MVNRIKSNILKYELTNKISLLGQPLTKKQIKHIQKTLKQEEGLEYAL